MRTSEQAAPEGPLPTQPLVSAACIVQKCVFVCGAHAFVQMQLSQKTEVYKHINRDFTGCITDVHHRPELALWLSTAIPCKSCSLCIGKWKCPFDNISAGQLLAKGVGDANAAAQDAALEALLAYLNASTEEQAAK